MAKNLDKSRLRKFYSPVHITNLSNGLRVVTEESSSPLVCTSLFTKAGSRFENENNNGIAYFVEHLAYQGFTSMSNYALQDAIRNGGSKMSAFTSRDHQVFSAVGLKESIKLNISLLAQIICQIDLSECMIESQKQQLCFEAIENDNNSRLVLFDYLHQTAFQETPLAQTVMGLSRNFCRFDIRDICSYFYHNYRPHRMTLATSGGVSHGAVVEYAENYFNVIKESDTKVINFGPKRYTGSSIVYRNDALPVAHVAIAVEAPGYNSPEYLPLLLASCLNDSWERTQGGGDRHGSFLARAASTSSLCEKFESFYIAYHDVGLWGVYFVGTNDLDDMVYNIQKDWMNTCTSVQKTDVDRASQLLKFKLAKNVEGVVKSSYDIGLQMMYTSSRRNLCQIYQDLSSITVERLRDVAFKYLYDKCPVVAAVGPTETLPDYNGIRSGMYWLRL
ncbi:cytochrome b-c1 complex subunit 1, mitochondrial-like [Danaus plexippus]|uniref:Uncharacterized protein n=1 Tax=Danaus plexippus plexippus TaxID=278856 RepID=A0A212EQF1_DANPL|nr:cytochrome b-c1 complex subunit 1, mitochondrial-like [Danaus plexippus]OWR43720.1 hypothetical protein KGM_203321 [Danaus plexippus plexippus]